MHLPNPPIRQIVQAQVHHPSSLNPLCTIHATSPAKTLLWNQPLSLRFPARFRPNSGPPPAAVSVSIPISHYQQCAKPPPRQRWPVFCFSLSTRQQTWFTLLFFFSFFERLPMNFSSRISNATFQPPAGCICYRCSPDPFPLSCLQWKASGHPGNRFFYRIWLAQHLDTAKKKKKDCAFSQTWGKKLRFSC